jgi:hypothetical protein
MHSCLKRLHAEIASAIKGMGVEELTRQPESKWSVAEILEHLYLTYTGTSKAFERCLEAGKPLIGRSTFKHRVGVLLVTRFGYFPQGGKSPESVAPRGMAAERVAAEIGPQIVAMDQVIAECEARLGSRRKLLDHPVLGPLTAREWREFHWIHGRHHVKQILERRTEFASGNR